MSNRVSVIIPVYNRKELIPYTLDSLDASLHPDVEIEVIAVDDGSTDGVMEMIANNYPTVRLLDNTLGKGASNARNVGLANATGDYVVYLDSDDLIGEGYFKEKIAFMEANPDVSACYGKYEYFSSSGAFSNTQITFKHKYPYLLAKGQTAKHLINNLCGAFIPPLAIVWRKSFLDRLGGHDGSLVINQDVELLIRALTQGLELVAVNDGTHVYVRNHSMDERVGSYMESPKKLQAILDIRINIIKQLRDNGFTGAEFMQAMSQYLFSHWRRLRHSEPEIASQFLALAKDTYWPIPVKGSLPFRLLGKLLGPVAAVNIKERLGS